MNLKKYLREWSEDENPLQDFADLVGKGGPYENRDIASYLKSSFGVSRDIKPMTIEKVMNMLEDHNYHTEYAMLEALKKKKMKAVKGLIDVAKLHVKVGYMTQDLNALRGYLSGSKYWNGMNNDMLGGMQMSADTKKLATKHLSKKELEEFTSAFRA